LCSHQVGFRDRIRRLAAGCSGCTAFLPGFEPADAPQLASAASSALRKTATTSRSEKKRPASASWFTLLFMSQPCALPKPVATLQQVMQASMDCMKTQLDSARQHAFKAARAPRAAIAGRGQQHMACLCIAAMASTEVHDPNQHFLHDGAQPSCQHELQTTAVNPKTHTNYTH